MGVVVRRGWVGMGYCPLPTSTARGGWRGVLQGYEGHLPASTKVPGCARNTGAGVEVPGARPRQQHHGPKKKNLSDGGLGGIPVVQQGGSRGSPPGHFKPPLKWMPLCMRVHQWGCLCSVLLWSMISMGVTFQRFLLPHPGLLDEQG